MIGYFNSMEWSMIFMGVAVLLLAGAVWLHTHEKLDKAHPKK